LLAGGQGALDIGRYPVLVWSVSRLEIPCTTTKSRGSVTLRRPVLCM
jgi:hypothetical protein